MSAMSDTEQEEELIQEVEDDNEEDQNLEQAERYEYALRDAVWFTNDASFADYSTHWFPFLRVNVIIFPEQHSPHVFRESERRQFFRVWESAMANGFVVSLPKHFRPCMTPPFVTTVCKVLRANQATIGVELLGTTRCKVLEINEEACEVKVQILPEMEHPTIISRLLPKYAKSSTPYEQRDLAFRISGYPMNQTRDVTVRNAEKIVDSLSKVVPAEKVRSAFEMGLTHFSYYAARNMLANRELEYKILKENSVDTRIAMAVEHCQTEWGLCSGCEIPLFSKGSILSANDSNMTHVNEHGYVHRITLVSELVNFNRLTLPSMDFTWFPSYSWVIIECSQCQNHIGWEYASEERRPHHFFGLQREGIKFSRNEKDDVVVLPEDNSEEDAL